jgi:hypothetical protein
MHQSIATIDKPEFINLKPMEINPLMSSCEIKVLYLGENRNHSYIDKDVATEMAKTLRGAPIVGYYKESKEDFADHGERIIFDDEGIKFECMTVPYGFVSPDAKVWFQTFEDEDGLGNTIKREYLMTTGYLWTGQFEECQSIVEGDGKPHSMELDENTVKGKWTKNYKTGMDFFIINDAIFSKLCVLGEDVEPCFEGSSITAPKVSANFTKVDDDFKRTLYTMMQELRFALEGGQAMENKTSEVQDSSAVKDNFNLDNTAENQINTEGATSTEGTNSATTEFVNKEEDDKNKNDDSQNKDNSDASNSEDKTTKEDDKKSDEDETKKKYSLLESQYAELNAKFAAIQEDYQALKKFKADIEDKEKDELINRFYMLDDEDKKDIIANKSKFSLDDIEAKLSVIYAKKTIAAGQPQTKTEGTSDKSVVTTFNLNDNMNSGIPDWVKAVEETENSKN